MKELRSLIIDTVIIVGAIFVMFSLLLCGCATQPLKGGKATTRRPGSIEQTLMQSDNPSQASRQDQETVRTRSYTVPTGSRMQNGTNAVVVVSAPMPVIEREETRAKTELGAAQKDTARELGAKLASLKGIVWVGVVMFVFGLASMFYPPIKLLIGSVTTSAAITIGGPIFRFTREIADGFIPALRVMLAELNQQSRMMSFVPVMGVG